ncbi:42280_t:CDS:2, partial [Gigaspora margarita]
MVLSDTTYKTNIYKLLFVNFVGIGNLGINGLQTFGIASIWISDKSENSNSWVIKQLILLVFYDISFLVLVTDNDAALTSTIRKFFPKAEYLLYCLINIRYYDAFNSTIANYKKLALMSLNKNERNGSVSIQAKLCTLVQQQRNELKLRLHHEKNSLQYENKSISIDPLLIQDYKDRLEPLLKKQKSALLSQLDDILTVPEVKLFDIKVPKKIKEKDCPSEIKQLLTALE